MNSLLSVGSILVSWQKVLGVARRIKPEASSIFTDLASDIIGREEPSKLRSRMG
jgi:hypothetical protein